MKTSITTAGAVIAAMGLTGCVDMGSSNDPALGNPTELSARNACVRDVRQVTNNPDVVVQSSSFSEAGTEVLLLVGGTGSWRCIGYRDGTTAEIMSLSNEGFS